MPDELKEMDRAFIRARALLHAEGATNDTLRAFTQAYEIALDSTGRWPRVVECAEGHGILVCRTSRVTGNNKNHEDIY